MSLANMAVGLAIVVLVVLSIAYPIIKNTIANLSQNGNSSLNTLTGTDLLIVGTVPTLLLVMLVVKIASSM